MFTGIVNAVGIIRDVIDCNGDKSFIVTSEGLNLEDVRPGDSICINGVCLTVVSKSEDSFRVDVSSETLVRTNLMEYKAGTRVNLEKALQLTDRLNGHIVSGHVDGVGIVTAMDDEARSTRCEIEIPDALLKYMCIKGSVCIDGVSLTINEIRQNRAGVNIIPFTRFNTVVSDYRPGRRVNIEVDIVARYLESLINTRQ